jgi:hypothetical protein
MLIIEWVNMLCVAVCDCVAVLSECNGRTDRECSYVIGGLHDKLFEYICSIHTQQDEALDLRIQQLSQITQTDLGVRSELRCEMPEAIYELQQLNRKVSPLEKLSCLQEVTALITKAIERTIRPSARTQKGKQSVMCCSATECIYSFYPQRQSPPMI